jgi:hypothetical protein
LSEIACFRQPSWKSGEGPRKLPFMRAERVHKVVPTSICLLFLASISFAVIVHDTVRYERPVRSIRGRVTGYGQVVPAFRVDVYDNAQVCLNESMPFVEKRRRQTKVASVEPNEKGEFNIKHLPKGFYEVEFGNHGDGGYNDLSVLVNVDPKGTNDKLCVDVSLESGPGKNIATKCGAQ